MLDMVKTGEGGSQNTLDVPMELDCRRAVILQVLTI